MTQTLKKHQMVYEVSQAMPDDVLPVANFLNPQYFEESMFSDSFTINWLNLIDTITNQIISNRSVGYVAKDEHGDIVGYCSMVMDWTYYNEPEADIEIFYVCKEYRGTPLARDLVEQVLETARASNARIVYAACACGFDDGGKNNKIWENLYRKFDFEMLGPTLYKII